jgi:transposase
MYEEQTYDRVLRLEEADLEPVSLIPRLNLPDLEETACFKPKGCDDYLVIHCRPVDRYSQQCPICQKKTILNIHGYLGKDRLVHDVNVGVQQIDLSVRVPRYRCEECGNTFAHTFQSIMENRQMTYRLYEQIRRDSFVRTYTDVSAAYGFSATTIASIFDEYAEELEGKRSVVVAPRVLGIDEKHIVHAMRAVFVDIETGVLLEMKGGNKKADIIGTIQSMVDYDKNIEIVTMDMSPAYRSYVQECIPFAKIVVDKYHVFQLLQTRVKKVRTRLIDMFANIVKEEPDAAKQDRMKLVLNAANKDHYLFKFGARRLEEDPARLMLMADLCRTFPEFNHLRLLKENFEKIYDAETREEAERLYEEWAPLVPPKGKLQMAKWQEKYNVPPELYAEFRSFANTLTNWYNEIFSYFDDGCRFTNAATEGLNNLIERFSRLGNGYSFERLRAKALFWHMAAPRTRYVLSAKKLPVYAESHTTSFRMRAAIVGSYSYDLPKKVGTKTIHIIEEEPSLMMPRTPLSVFVYAPKSRE